MTSKVAVPCLVVVEDDADSRRALTRLLTSSGYHVRAAGSVGEAIALVDLHGCDLLISDVGLPDGSGLDLVRRLRESYGLTRAIALTGWAASEYEKDCGDAGFLRFLAKPISFDVLLKEVKALLEPAAERLRA